MPCGGPATIVVTDVEKYSGVYVPHGGAVQCPAGSLSSGVICVQTYLHDA